MVALDSLVHFSTPFSDIAASTRFYTEIIGLKHLQTVAHGTIAFLDASPFRFRGATYRPRR